MKYDYEPFDYVRFEVEQLLIPTYYLSDGSIDKLFYKGILKEKQVLDFYAVVCKDEKIECLYKEEDFKVTYYKYGKLMNVIKIDLPDFMPYDVYNETIYLLYYSLEEKQPLLKYCMFIRNDCGKRHILQAKSGANMLYGEELSNNATDDEINEILYKYYKVFLNDDLCTILKRVYEDNL